MTRNKILKNVNVASEFFVFVDNKNTGHKGYKGYTGYKGFKGYKG